MVDAFIGNSDKGKILLPLDLLKRHFIALGSSGSGKTVLCKALIEESSRKGIPSIIIDPQGDLASLSSIGSKEDLKKNNIEEDMISSFKNNSKVNVFTPCSSKGIPVCINPLKLPETKIDEEELSGVLNEITASIATLLNFKGDKADSIKTLLYYILDYCYKKKIILDNFNDLIELLSDLPSDIRSETEGLVNKKDLILLEKKLKIFTVGGKELLFNFGFPLNINNLVKRGNVNIFFLNSLKSEAEKQFFVSTLAAQLYNWMLAHPSKNTQLLFYIDEISEYLPAGSKKPPAKDILNLLYKQARKYGIGCIVSTQNPGDIDYKAFAQFGTWAVGRLTTKQDLNKVKGALSSVTPKFSDITDNMPKLKPAEFFLFSPDYSNNIIRFRSRYLITEHKTLTIDDISKLEKREFKEQITRKKIKVKNKTDKKHFKIKISEEQLNNIINSLKKKSFILFGSKKENIDYIKTILNPLYVLTVRKSSEFILKKNKEEYNILVDAIYGDIFKFEKDNLKRFDGFHELTDLKEIELNIVKLLLKRNLSLKGITSELKISESLVKSNLNKLMKNNLIMSKNKVFGLFFSMNLPNDPVKLNSEITETSNEAIQNNQYSESKIDFKKIKSAFESFYKNTEIIEHKTIFYPVFEVKLSHKNKSRIFLINGINGKII